MLKTSNNYRRVAVTDLKKISEAFKILQESNQALTRNMQKMASYYADKYKTKLNQMQTLIVKKDRQLRLLHKQLEEKGRKTVFVVRQENCIKFYSSLDSLNKYMKHQASIKALNIKILLCRSVTDIKRDRSVCIALARAKYKNFVSIENKCIIFNESADADSFEQDIKQMLT